MRTFGYFECYPSWIWGQLSGTGSFHVYMKFRNISSQDTNYLVFS